VRLQVADFCGRSARVLRESWESSRRALGEFCLGQLVLGELWFCESSAGVVRETWAQPHFGAVRDGPRSFPTTPPESVFCQVRLGRFQFSARPLFRFAAGNPQDLIGNAWYHAFPIRPSGFPAAKGGAGRSGGLGNT
jgi:hypothetical protein